MLTQIQMLASLGVLTALAMDEERRRLRTADIVGACPPDLVEVAAARRWLQRQLRDLDVSGLPSA